MQANIRAWAIMKPGLAADNPRGRGNSSALPGGGPHGLPPLHQENAKPSRVWGGQSA